MKVIGVSGLPGSGKSLISKIAKNNELNVIKMGDIVREEAIKGDESSAVTAVNLRKEHGEYVLAKLIIEKITKKLDNNNNKTNKESIYIIEGIRSQYEVELFKKSFKDFLLISIFSSPSTRFNRLANRNREDDSSDFEKFKQRDQRELNFGIGNVISTADYLIVNESDLESYENEILNLLKKEIIN